MDVEVTFQTIWSTRFRLVESFLGQLLEERIIAFQVALEGRLNEMEDAFHTKLRREVVALCEEERTEADATHFGQLFGADSPLK